MKTLTIKEYALFKNLTVGAIYNNKSLNFQKVGNVKVVVLSDEEAIEAEKFFSLKNENVENLVVENQLLEKRVEELTKRLEDSEKREQESKILLFKALENYTTLSKQIEYIAEKDKSDVTASVPTAPKKSFWGRIFGK